MINSFLKGYIVKLICFWIVALVTHKLLYLAEINVMISILHNALISDFSEFLNTNYPQYSSLILSIIAGGNNSSLDSNYTKLFKNLNILHLLSVSGGNFEILTRSIYLFKRVIGAKISNFLAILSINFYIALIGFSNFPSLRAYIFSSLNSYSKISGRPVKFTHKILLTFLILSVFSPTFLTSRSFWISILFSTVYFLINTGVFKKIFNNEFKQITIMFLISSLIFENTNPDFIANLAATIFLPIVIILTLTTYTCSGFGSLAYLNTQLETAIEVFIELLSSLNTNLTFKLQLIIFVVILIVIVFSNGVKKNHSK